MICPTGIADYFSSKDWTGQITLESFGKLAFLAQASCAGKQVALQPRGGFARRRRNQLSSLAVRRGHALLGRQDRGALFVVRIGG
jgi:hypothetical protein